MFVPNVLITNYCNQNCSFCFAKKLMAHKRESKEMSLNDFKVLIKKIKAEDINNKMIKFLGGEPTLHSQFDQIIEYSATKFASISIFTNGIFSDKRAKFMEQFYPKISFVYNVSTPGFLENNSIREIVCKRIKDSARLTEVSIAVTLIPKTSYLTILNKIPLEVLKNITHIRMGVANPIIGEKNFYQFDEFNKIGFGLVALIKKIKIINPKISISFDCGFTRCMFSEKQYSYIKKNVKIFQGFGCFGKASFVDIKTNLDVIHCYALSNPDSYNVKRDSLSKINNHYSLKKYIYINKIILDKCKTCRYFGDTSEKCSGPCSAFKFNILRKHNVVKEI